MMIDRKREMLIIESNEIYWREQSMNKRTITIIQNLCEPNKERTIAYLQKNFTCHRGQSETIWERLILFLYRK